MELLQLMEELNKQNETGKGYQIHLNSGNLEENSFTSIELCDLYFSKCRILNNGALLCFDNSTRQPIGEKESGTKLYPQEMNSNMFIDISKIKTIEEVKDAEDWFSFPSEKVFNIYMLPENKNMDGCGNIVTVGFIG